MSESTRKPISENARRLEIGIITILTVNGVPTEDEIFSLAKQLRLMPLLKVSDEEFDAVIRRLHQSLRIDMGLGHCVFDDHEPWLQARKAEIIPFYWSRYQTELRKQGWVPKVLVSLDKVTDDILDLLGDPNGNSAWPRRGLVMGDVQSGKTSNYTGLICKAADSGYRLVILLTGTLESLRRQTQERLDAGFVGLDSSGMVNRNKQRREIGVGLIDGARAAGVFTSTMVDFRTATVNQLGFRLEAFNEPVLLVVKKNKRILENLTEWLVDFNAKGGKIDLPLLVIDDEADNASVNTNPSKATAINAGIRNLLKVFPKSSYVGFTATPFANVFINPDSIDDMVGDDLFPRDFIYALDAPTNYVGANRIFGDESDLDCLRKISDAEAVFPRGHKSNHFVEGIPKSLLEAINCFFVVNAIIDLRGATPKHRSMLINVSHMTLVQEQVKGLIDQIVRKIQEDIRNYASLPLIDAIKSSTLDSLYQTFKFEYADCGESWKSVQSKLATATLPIEVRSVNQKSGSASLDYSLYKQNGLRVIAVGGNSLARGLTLEGLCVSYFFRSTQMYDTLLQMGRWFGYRSGYEDLFRIWMTDDVANWYSLISEATDELRDEIKKMQVSRLKPIDFGLKVRAHPESLLITARNKMRHSEEIIRLVSISGEGIESSRLLSDQEVIKGNFIAFKKFIASIQFAKCLMNIDSGYPIWTNVNKQFVVELLKKFVTHPLNVKFQSNDLSDFIANTIDRKLEKWDIAVPSGSIPWPEIIPGLELSLRKRNIRIDKESRSILVNEKKMRVGSRGDEKIGMKKGLIDMAELEFFNDPDNAKKKNVSDKAYRKYRERPLLLIHLLQGTEDGVDIIPNDGSVLIALGLSFPELDNASHKIRYRINLVELRNMLSREQEEAEAPDDPEEDDAE